jgi:hypothetical protein
LSQQKSLKNVFVQNHNLISISSILKLPTEGGCGGRGVGFGVSGNVTFQLTTGKYGGAGHSNANEQSSLFVSGDNASTCITAF